MGIKSEADTVVRIEDLGDLVKDVELAEFFEVTTTTVRGWMKREMGGFKLGRVWYITKDQLFAHIARKSEEQCLKKESGKGVNTTSHKKSTVFGKSVGTTQQRARTVRDANQRALEFLKKL